MGYYRPEFDFGDIKKLTTREQVELVVGLGVPSGVLGEALETDPSEIEQWRQGDIFMPLEDPRREQIEAVTETVQDGLQRNLTAADITRLIFEVTPTQTTSVR